MLDYLWDDCQLDAYLQGIQDLSQLTSTQFNELLTPFTIEETIYETSGVEKKVSSPGEDSLDYAFLYQLFRYPSLQDMVLQNWRPISLINCDAKIYTRILNTQLRKVISTLITRFQTGFMPNRFIDENGLVLNVVIEHGRRCKRPEITLLLDQGKTYDRVHPSYLKSVLLKFRSSSTLVNSIIGLFFGNRVCININRHFTEEVDQCRGHRQGDLLSPLLFNLALEPFLRHVLRDTSLVCFSFPDLSSTLSPPVALKELAYADDVCVFLSSQADFIRVQHHLDTYGLVSNAKINLSKTEWHDYTMTQLLRYLGFSVIQFVAQRNFVENHLLQNIQSQFGIHSQCHFSFRSRVTVANSLILSKLWYILRVVSLTKHFFGQIRSNLYQFITQGIKPIFRYDLLCHLITTGDLGLLDLVAQQGCLQFLWLRMLFQEDVTDACGQLYLKDFAYRFHSLEFRQNHIANLHPSRPPALSSLNWTRFWPLKVLPEARTLCFRFIYGKLHCQNSVTRFNPDVSGVCRFCLVPNEDINHMLIFCPAKWQIWQEALCRFAPHIEFDHCDIQDILQNLQRYDFVDNTQLHILCFYILLFIWRAHWRYIFDNVLLSRPQLISTIFEKFKLSRLH
ncbi:hypothetical protein G6F37_002808 [Rhizopus arrhizus]|nr:hypothetical protein G6F38_008202 [Rhizopus arrhizus]KAG1161724.1 hypothetical protein G6F37_002808 [Rhizopus arrhizus]